MQDMLYLCAFDLMGPMTVSQLERFLQGADVAVQNQAQTLADLVEKKQLSQTVSLQGILYVLTEAGKAYLDAGAPVAQRNAMTLKAKEFRHLFDREKEYLAQYTEQANAVVPIFLSIRDGDRILMKINVIVETVEQAKEITSKWMENAHGAYQAVWEAVGNGAPMPGYFAQLLEKEKRNEAN